MFWNNKKADESCYVTPSGDIEKKYDESSLTGYRVFAIFAGVGDTGIEYTYGQFYPETSEYFGKRFATGSKQYFPDIEDVIAYLKYKYGHYIKIHKSIGNVKQLEVIYDGTKEFAPKRPTPPTPPPKPRTRIINESEKN